MKYEVILRNIETGAAGIKHFTSDKHIVDIQSEITTVISNLEKEPPHRFKRGEIVKINRGCGGYKLGELLIIVDPRKKEYGFYTIRLSELGDDDAKVKEIHASLLDELEEVVVLDPALFSDLWEIEVKLDESKFPQLGKEVTLTAAYNALPVGEYIVKSQFDSRHIYIGRDDSSSMHLVPVRLLKVK
jgi:hypothetical protein